MKRDRLSRWLVCALQLIFMAASTAAVVYGEGSAPDDLSAIRNRYVLSVLPADPMQTAHLRELGTRYANSLQPDGLWPDIEYENEERSVWKAADHLNRILVMAKVARLFQNQNHADSALNAKIIRALEAWVDHDYRNPNWWWNEIGVPELTGEIATLMGDEIPEALRDRIEEIMKRSDWRRVPWTGANLIWGVEIEIVRGCLEDSAAEVAEGYGRMYEEIRIVGPVQEGIEQDESFHQHGAQLYNGGYGLDYANDVGRFIAFAWGTHFQVPADRMAIYSSYVLDGLQWMIRGDVIDYSVVGREITRKGKVVAPRDWSAGPVSPAGAAYSLENVVAMLASEPTPRHREFQAFAERLKGHTDAPAFTGNRQFWCSDFMVHRRAAFSTSVKMLSNRMLNGETVNGEGKRSQHLSDGVNLLYRTGNEYKDIFPVWDWTRLPGTTAIQGALETGEPNSVGVKGMTPFAGGVSDGTYGMAAMDLSRGKLAARKAWFFFDEGYLCLGAGITLQADPAHTVATDVNQTLLHDSVITSRSKEPVAEGKYTFTSKDSAWVYHDQVGYVLAPESHVILSVGPQTGKWSDIGSGSSEPVTLPVFDLWIDHGNSPHASTYQYLVLPGASLKETSEYAKQSPIRVLANDERTQAVWNGRLGVAMIVFRDQGSQATPFGTVSVDHPCLLLIRRDAHHMKISAANPLNLPLTLRVEVGRRATTIDLPGGNLAGSSVTAIVR